MTASRRARLAPFLVALLALGGAWTTPSRLVESTRLIASCVRLVNTRTEVRVAERQLDRTPQPSPSVTLGRPAQAAARSLALDPSRFQRPPPPIS
jgi:hypothetical protein